MQVNLPKEIESLVRERAAAAGFDDRIEAYLAHLVQADETEDYGAPLSLSISIAHKDAVDAMIEAGMESGEATVMANSDWIELHKRIDARQSNSTN